jgi:hypothetical protein
MQMTVNDLIERLVSIKKYGHGDDEIQAWDPDSEQYEGVTCLTYGGGEPVKIYTDDP